MALVVIVVGFMINLRPQPPKVPVVSPSPPYRINKQGDFVLAESQSFEIIFQPRYKKYIISITGAPFSKIRQLAEARFLLVAGLTQLQACDYDVSVSTPYFANPQESGKIYPLSFCVPSGASPRPSPTSIINPSLAPLVLKSAAPIEGEAAMGNTQNAISLNFDQPVNSSTVFVESDPDVKLSPVIRKDDLKKLLLVPSVAWKSNTNYIIKIRAGLTTSDGKLQTKTDIVLQYGVVEPPLPAYDREP